MLVNFSIVNYKSLREEANLSMVASAMKEPFPLPANAMTEVEKDLRILPIAALYGANASGKSNLVEAIGRMKHFVLTSLARENVLGGIPVQPFRLSTTTVKGPTELEVSLISNNTLYRYGFLASQERVEEEWLFERALKPRSKEKQLFYRENNAISFHSTLFKIGGLINTQRLLKEDVLILTLASQLNDDNAKRVIQWLDQFNVIEVDDDSKRISIDHIKDQTGIGQDIENLIRLADTGISRLEAMTTITEETVAASHTIYNGQGEPQGEYLFLMETQESAGTNKLFNLSGPIFCALREGSTLVVDELDAKLHPNLVEKIVLMFQDKQINKRGAQLIFTTHNTNLLSAKLLRRDQVWITEKDKFGATKLYSIADYKAEKGKARNTEAIEQNYIDGKYGGIPFLGELENFLDRYDNGTKDQA